MRQQLSDEAVASRTFEEEYLYGESTDTIEALLESHGISKAELARRLGLSRGRVSQALSGKENLTLRSLASLGWALGVRFELRPTPIADRAATPAAGDPSPPRWLGKLVTRPVPQYRPIPPDSVAVPEWRRSTLRARGGQVQLSEAS